MGPASDSRMKVVTIVPCGDASSDAAGVWDICGVKGTGLRGVEVKRSLDARTVSDEKCTITGGRYPRSSPESRAASNVPPALRARRLHMQKKHSAQ